ncbi:winged helix-turn-helix transcriptional regulator [Streptomyces murinus]|uniref:winged helix-turn-helix transcriptional regulator n=1 Tax=Streptomyces murinus TaxID=33900 RepID=UPI003F44BFA2
MITVQQERTFRETPEAAMPDKRYYCPVEVTVELIGGKMETLILAHLKEGVHRYGELLLPHGRHEEEKACSHPATP